MSKCGGRAGDGCGEEVSHKKHHVYTHLTDAEGNARRDVDNRLIRVYYHLGCRDMTCEDNHPYCQDRRKTHAQVN